jgi:hypothetical protein
MQAARSWLLWFLTRVVGMKGVPDRESRTKKETKQKFRGEVIPGGKPTNWINAFQQRS